MMSLPRLVSLPAAFAAGALAFGAVMSWADTPGQLFQDINEEHAMVVQQTEGKARIFKEPKLVSVDLCKAIAEGAQPVGDSVVLVHEGKLYILPDKKVGNHMATEMVMNAAGAPARD